MLANPLKETRGTIVRLTAYQALLSHPDNLKRVRAAQAQIARIGGKITLEPPNQLGLTLVTLWLPDNFTPEQVLPGIPFYPI